MQTVLARIQDCSRQHRHLLIGIDGRAGAGKSTLARELASALPDAGVIEFDWFHFPKEQVSSSGSYDFERFRAEVVKPFKRGLEVSFRRYNWGYLAGIKDGLEAEAYRMPQTKVLIVEGCQVLTSEIADCFDLRVWVDTEADEALKRGMRRDIDEYGIDPLKVETLWSNWTAREERLLSQEDRSLKADVRYAGE